MVYDDGSSVFWKFRNAAGIMHTKPNNGPLSDKSDPPTSQFAGYGPALIILCVYIVGTHRCALWDSDAAMFISTLYPHDSIDWFLVPCTIYTVLKAIVKLSNLVCVNNYHDTIYHLVLTCVLSAKAGGSKAKKLEAAAKVPSTFRARSERTPSSNVR